MKTTTLTLAIASMFLLFLSCSTEETQEPALETAHLTSNEFVQAQAQIEQTLLDIFTSIQEKDADRLISFHAYGPKFTEYKDGERRTGSAENEAYERGLVAAISAFDYDLHDLKIDVFYGNVGKVTFHADFRPTIDGNTFQLRSQATLLFIRVGKDWKIVHEHLSPLNE